VLTIGATGFSEMASSAPGLQIRSGARKLCHFEPLLWQSNR